MKRVVVTGLGFITSIGNNRADVSKNLRECRTGIEFFDELDQPNVPVRLAGTVKGFRFPGIECEDWEYPKEYSVPREHLRGMGPSVVYAWCAMQQAIADARLGAELV